MSAPAFIFLAMAGVTFLMAAGLLLAGVWHRPWRALRLVVAARRDATADLFVLTLRRRGLARILPLPRFAAGQSVALAIPGDAARRRYSIARWQAVPFTYELAIKREPQGRFSPLLAEHAKPGALLVVGRPDGRFAFPRRTAARRAVFIAGGVGITPLMAMIDQWSKTRRPYAEAHLYWQVRHEQEVLYRGPLAPGFKRRNSVHARILVSRPSIGAGEKFSVDLLVAELGTLTDTDFYLCASSSLLDHLIAGLKARGVAKEALHFERFSLPANGEPHQGWTVEFAGHRFEFAGHRSLLEAIESQSLPIDADCRTGTCGRCLVRIEHGLAHHRVAPDCDVPPGHVLACCALPGSHVRVGKSSHSANTLNTRMLPTSVQR
jgi:ferredoxin-NADP reductase